MAIHSDHLGIIIAVYDRLRRKLASDCGSRTTGSGPSPHATLSFKWRAKTSGAEDLHPKLGGRPTEVRRAPLVSRQPACKPGSGWHAGRARIRDGHSSGTPVARRLKQPTRTAGSGHRSRSFPRLRAKASRRPYSVLLPVGFAVPPALPPARCALTAPFHPYRGPQRSTAVCSLWHFPWARTRRMLSGTACPRSPDFPPRQPFGFAGAAVRPTDAHRHGGACRRRQGRRPIKLTQDTRTGATSVVDVRARAAMVRRPAAIGEQFLQGARVDGIEHAVDALGAEMALEGRHDVARRQVVFAVDLDAVAIVAEQFLQRRRRRCCGRRAAASGRNP